MKNSSTPPASARDLLARNLATLGPIGYLPLAPGTWGSGIGLLFLIVANPQPVVLFFLTAASAGAGVLAAGVAERSLGPDSTHIVIDEFTGILVAALAVPASVWHLLAVFLLFRFFDILKPFPIGKLEETFHGGIGVMIDDIVAGIYTNLVLQAWTYLGVS